MSFSVSDTVSSAQQDLERLVSDLRGLLASKDLDSIPQIGALRDRIDEGLSRARESAVEAAQEAARQAREAAAAADRGFHRLAKPARDPETARTRRGPPTA